MKPENADAWPRTISTEQAGELLMLTAERVRQLAKTGHIPKSERNRVSFVGAVQGYVCFLKDEQRRNTQARSQSRVADARAKAIEIRNAQQLGRLVEMETVDFLFADIFQTLREEIDGVPAASTRDLKVREAVATKLAEAFGRARSRWAQRRADLQAGRELVITEDDAGL